MMIGIILTILGVFFFLIMFLHILISINKFRKAKIIKKEYGIPEGDIKYTDLDKPAKPLFSARDKLVGKPDFIVKRKEGYIPVEVKSSNTDIPYKSHIMQLAAYCLLVEEEYGTKVPYGIIVYGEKQFKIPHTKSLRTSLIKTIDEIRNCLRTNSISRNHESINKCANCSLRDDCKDSVFS